VDSVALPALRFSSMAVRQDLIGSMIWIPLNILLVPELAPGNKSHDQDEVRAFRQSEGALFV
jgi:cell division septation protein DedD